MENKGTHDEGNLSPLHTWRLRVGALAHAQGFNEERLALVSGIPAEQMKTIWNDPASDASLSLLETIARALGVKITDLIEDVSHTEDRDQTHRRTFGRHT